MDQRITSSWERKVFPWLTAAIGTALMLAQWIVRLNLLSVVAVAYCCILSAVILIARLAKKKVYAPMVLGYAASMVGIIVYYILWGADAGFGAFTSGLAGFLPQSIPFLRARAISGHGFWAIFCSPCRAPLCFGRCFSRQGTMGSATVHSGSSRFSSVFC